MSAEYFIKDHKITPTKTGGQTGCATQQNIVIT